MPLMTRPHVDSSLRPKTQMKISVPPLTAYATTTLTLQKFMKRL